MLDEQNQEHMIDLSDKESSAAYSFFCEMCDEKNEGVLRFGDIEFVPTKIKEDGEILGHYLIPDGYIPDVSPEQEEKLLAYLTENGSSSFGIRSVVEQATAIKASFTSKVHKVSGGYIVQGVLKSENTIPITANLTEKFALGRFYFANSDYQALNGDLNQLILNGIFCDTQFIDPTGKDPKKIRFFREYYGDDELEKYIPQKHLESIFVTQLPLSDAFAVERKIPLITHVPQIVGIAIPITRKFIITAESININDIAALKAKDRDKLDQMLGIVEVDNNFIELHEGEKLYILQETIPFKIPPGFIAMVDQSMLSEKATLELFDPAANDNWQVHLPSPIIDTGWGCDRDSDGVILASGEGKPIRGEFVVHQGHNDFMILTIYRNGYAAIDTENEHTENKPIQTSFLIEG